MVIVESVGLLYRLVLKHMYDQIRKSYPIDQHYHDTNSLRQRDPRTPP